MEVTLNRNGFHMKLQKFVFGKPPQFNSLCPYFWLTVFCFIITFVFPIIPVVKSIMWLVQKFAIGFDNIFNWFDAAICQPLFEEISKRMPEEDIVDSWISYNSHYFCSSDYDKMSAKQINEWNFWRTEYNDGKYYYGTKARNKAVAKFELWKKNNPDWEKQLAEVKNKIKENYEKEKIKQEKWRIEYEADLAKKRIKEEAINKKRMERLEKTKVSRQKTFNFIIKYTKYLAYLIGGLLIIGAAYLTYNGIVYIIKHIDVDKFLRTLKYCLIILGIGSVVVSIAYFIAKLIVKCKIHISDFPKLNKFFYSFAIPFIFIGKCLTWPIKGIIKIGEIFKFIFMYLKSTKDNYCPAINWVDEEKTK